MFRFDLKGQTDLVLEQHGEDGFIVLASAF